MQGRTKSGMVLVTGATGFVGRALVPKLLAHGRTVGCLRRPTNPTSLFPPGVLQISTGSLHDPSALRAAVQSVDTIVHLAGARSRDDRYSLEEINHQGTVNLVEAAQTANVKRIIFLSQINADRNSAFPLLRSKGAAEEAIRTSGLDYTILRSSLIFGSDDHFTTVLAMLIKMNPIAIPVPGSGKTRFQPIHVDDVGDCLNMCIDDHEHLANVTLPIGGPQHLSYSEILDAVMEVLRVRRIRVNLRLPTIRPLVQLSRHLFPYPLVTEAQLDLFSVDNTTDLGNIPRNFGFEPQRFTSSLGYLRRGGWRRAFLRQSFRGKL